MECGGKEPGSFAEESKQSKAKPKKKLQDTIESKLRSKGIEPTKEVIERVQAELESNKIKETEKIKTFVPAKTREEAEQFALNNLVNQEYRKSREESRQRALDMADRANKVPGVSTHYVINEKDFTLINYRGLDLNIVNKINETVNKNVHMGLANPREIVTTQFKKGSDKETTLAIARGQSLELNTVNIGNNKKVQELIDKAASFRDENGLGLMKELEQMNTNGRLDDHGKFLYGVLQEAQKYSREGVGYEKNSTPERAIEATINHEFGHMMLRDGGKFYNNNEFKNDMKAITINTLESDYKYKLSSYGGGVRTKTITFGTQEECFCEMYAAWRFFEDENLHPNAIKFFQKYLPDR